MADFGFAPVAQKGSHVKFRHADGRVVSIPRHANRDIGRRLLMAIMEEAGIDPDTFLAPFR